jgi:hypothetical protein
MHQHQGPSPVLFQLLGMMVEASKDITAVKDILTGDTGGKVQTATTTLAMIEQGLKVFTAIYKRIYRALKDEFRLLFELNARHIDEKAYYTFNDEQEVVEKSDYDLSSMDICPVADPKMVTDMQRKRHWPRLLPCSMPIRRTWRTSIRTKTGRTELLRLTPTVPTVLLRTKPTARRLRARRLRRDRWITVDSGPAIMSPTAERLMISAGIYLQSATIFRIT